MPPRSSGKGGGALRLTAGWEDIRELTTDLENVKDGLGRALADGIASDALPLLQETRALTPYGPGPRASAFETDDALPHIRDTLGVSVEGGAVALYAQHPGARVLEWGGTIAPHGQPIKFREHAMARTAAEHQLPVMEERVNRRIDSLLQQHL
jgi:hypothetical protein